MQTLANQPKEPGHEVSISAVFSLLHYQGPPNLAYIFEHRTMSQTAHCSQEILNAVAVMEL